MGKLLEAFLSKERKPWERKLFASQKEAFFSAEKP